MSDAPASSASLHRSAPVVGGPDQDGDKALIARLLDGEDVCALLDISEANQRVLLHRARVRTRAALDRHLRSPAPPEQIRP